MSHVACSIMIPQTESPGVCVRLRSNRRCKVGRVGYEVQRGTLRSTKANFFMQNNLAFDRTLTLVNAGRRKFVTGHFKNFRVLRSRALDQREYNVG
jgi:hypothetical protein